MRAQEFITDALVHRAHVGSSDPNDIWHVRDDTTRKLRSRRNQVVLANAQPVVMSADAMRSRTYNIGPNTGKRYQLLGGYHYAYLQGDLKSQFPDNVDQGRQLWFKNGRFIYADTQEPFTRADYVHFAPDRTVTAYNVEQGNKLKEALHFVRPGELRGSYSDQQMQQMGFRRAQNGAWYIDQRRWDALVQQGKLREQHGVAEGSKMLSLDDKIKIYSKHKSQAQQAENRGDYTTADKHKKQASRIYSNIVNLHFGDDGKDAQNAANEYIRKSQGVAEGSLNESAVFLNPTTVVVGQAHGQPLELSPDTLKKIQDIAAKHGAWYEGNGTDRSYTKGQIDRYVGSWDDEVAKSASPNDPKWLYVLFANVDENNRVQRVGVDPKDTIFNRLLAGAQDNSFQGIGYTAQALQKFLQMASEGKYDFVKMSQQPATQENLTRFLKAGEALMWPSNWEQYPNRAGKIAKAATVDVRDQYLATRKAGVYVTGSGHLKAVQNITGQQGVAENFADGKVKGKSRPGRVKRSGASCNGSVTDLRARAKRASGEKAKMYHWCANMKSGRKK